LEAVLELQGKEKVVLRLEQLQQKQVRAHMQ
jgi:hypothetical protein